jgi:hypothetical protein
LLGRATVAVDDNDFINQATGTRFGLDGADHLLAPAIANQRVADSNRKAACLCLFGWGSSGLG